MKLSGKVAIITGSASGMGKAIALRFAKEGAAVVAVDIHEESNQSLVDDIHALGGKALSIVANVSDSNDIIQIIQTSKEKYGSIDILVNNAGIVDQFTPAGDTEDELWNRVLAINLTGPFQLARESILVMEQQDTGGVIINNTSVGGLFGARGGAAYVASKHGLVGLTKNIAATYGKHGKVRANAIAPGGVDTNIQSTIKTPNELGLKALNETGAAPLATPDQIAEVALFLASSESDIINGVILKADGGWTVG
ncbi:SDR family oxidoreductase [Bacillus sp. Marseille-P3800]|uniref:SDR family oxidoreductase n=1 Tax=Bacillus sp. Marseille-P3800 TaxID=2014782 RepID=UPI000C06F46A|nr:SDR family oxidoreductase [Bacillus sp. Marseille-P3800]